MRFLSLFAGIGGFDLGLERAGHECAGQVEIDPFCRRVLERRWPGVERWGDVRGVRSVQRSRRDDDSGVDVTAWGCERGGRVDLLTGGFPCQDLSVAGQRRGLGGDRSALFWEIVRIAHAIRPAWGLFENVPGLVSSHRGRDLWLVLQGLRQCWPAVGWRVLDSQHFGVPQRRRRLFLVGGPDAAGVASVLALWEGGGRHPAAGGAARPHLTARTGKGTDSDCTDGQLVVSSTSGAGWWREGVGTLSARDWRDSTTSGVVTRCLATGTNGNRYDGDTENFVVTHALTGTHGFDASEDGTGRDTPLIAFDPTASWDYALNGQTAPTLKRGTGLELGWAPAVAFSENQRAEMRLTEYSRQITTGGGKPGQGYPAAMVSGTVRRLTPVECERLQGFPDGWTCLCLPLEAYAEDAEAAALRCRCPDGPRYRALGNAVTVPVITWLGQRLAAL